MHNSTSLPSLARRAVAFSTLCLLASAPAMAQNLVSNPGFELGGTSGGNTCSTTGYTVNAGSGLAKLAVGAANAYAGNCALALATGFGSLTTGSSIAQTLSTVAGHKYNISFWAYNPGLADDGSNSLRVVAGGTEVFSRAINNNGYELFSAIATAGGSSSLFQIFVQNNADFTYLDNISVTEAGTSTVPEPSSMALMGTGLVGLVPVLRRKRK
ncbi:MAG: PEP-CTERM sorting domain-containing protein [Gemmatimonadaceae bacterium]